MSAREKKLAELEELCQQRYAIIDNCYQTIRIAQNELAKLEVKYLKLKARIDGSPTKQSKRLSKIDKLRKMMIDLGIDNPDEFLKLTK